MHPFERILLATEHTEFDSGSERVALDLAKRYGVPLDVVVPVVSNPEYETIAPQIAAHVEKQAALQMEKLRRMAQEAGVTIDITARRGEEPYREIVDEAEKRKSTLLVIRRRGKRSFLSDLMIGEMVSKVVGHAPCSVLCVPRAAKLWTHGLLAAVDTSPFAGHIAHMAGKIARKCGLPLNIVSVLEHDTAANRSAIEETLAHARASAASAGIPEPAIGMPLGKPHEQILASARELGADLVVIGKHGVSNLVRTPFGGNTQKVIGLAEAPVLVVHS